MQSQAIGQTGEIGAMKYALSRHSAVRSKILFDVGANNGQFVEYMSQIFPNNFLIYSFEPSRRAFNILQTSINKPNVQLFNHGFSNEEKEIKLFNPGALVGTLYPLNNKGLDLEKIKVKRIDDFCKQENIDKIYYLKIDVEGAEFDVLKGASNLIEHKKVSFIQFEYGPNCMISRVFLKDFFELLKDYQIYRIVKNGLRKLSYNELIEIPLTSNFIAELRAL